MPEEVVCGQYEFRMKGGEIHRRPYNWEKLPPVPAAWVVMNRHGDYVPQTVRDHFEQAKNKAAVN